MRTFARRNRALAVGATVAVAGLIIAVVASTVLAILAVRAEHEQRKARFDAELARRGRGRRCVSAGPEIGLRWIRPERQPCDHRVGVAGRFADLYDAWSKPDIAAQWRALVESHHATTDYSEPNADQP